MVGDLRSLTTTSMRTSASRDVPSVFVSIFAASLIARFSRIILLVAAAVVHSDLGLMTYNYQRLLARLVSTDIAPCQL